MSRDRLFRGEHDGRTRLSDDHSLDWVGLAERYGIAWPDARDLFSRAQELAHGAEQPDRAAEDIYLELLERCSRGASGLPAPGKAALSVRTGAAAAGRRRSGDPPVPGRVSLSGQLSRGRSSSFAGPTDVTRPDARRQLDSLLGRVTGQGRTGEADRAWLTAAFGLEPEPTDEAEPARRLVDAEVRRLEAQLGLSDLLVRFDDDAGQIARAHGTRGAAIGRGVVLDPIRFDPRSRESVELLAHEAVHVAQRRRPGASSPARAEAEASLLASEYARTGAISAPRQAIAAGHVARDEERPQAEHRDVFLANPVPLEMHAALGGLIFRPADESASWEPGIHIGHQLLAAVLHRLVGAKGYSLELLREALGMFPDVHRFVGAATRTATQTDRAIGSPVVGPATAAALVDWLEREKRLKVALTDEQRRILAGAVSAEEAWPLVRQWGNLPAWYDQELFRHEVAGHASLLERFGQASAAWKESGRPEQEDAVRDAAIALNDALIEKALAVDAIRTDAQLADHPLYRSLWRLPPVAPAAPAAPRASPVPAAPIVDAETQVNHVLAVVLLDVCNNEGTRSAMMRGGAAGHRTRKRVLDAIDEIARARQAEDRVGADQRLGDASSRATVPPVPSWMSAYPKLEHPLFDRASGAAHKFMMSLQYPDDLEAIAGHLGNHYHWEIIRVDQDEAARAKQTAEDLDTAGETPGWAGVHRQRLGRQLKNAAADIERGQARTIRGLESMLGPSGGGAETLVAASRMVGAVGTVIKTFIQQLTEPACERTIPFDAPGLYVVRCRATNLPDQEHQPVWVRAQSVAWLPVWVRPAKEMAELRGQLELEGRDLQSRRLAEIEAELGKPNLDDETRRRLADEKRQLEVVLRGSLADVLGLERDALTRRRGELMARRDSDRATGRSTEAADGELTRIQARLDELRDILATRAARMAEHQSGPGGPVLEPPFRLPATFIGDEGQVVHLALELVQERTSEPGTWQYYVSDSTTRDGGAGTGPARSGRTDAIREAVRDLLQAPDRYGRGHCTLLVPSASGDQAPPRQVTIRVEADDAAIAMEAIDNITTALSIAAVAAAPFTGGASLIFMVPIGIVGAIPSAYRLADRASAHTLRVDLAAATDIANIVGAAAGLGQMAAGARFVRVGGACLIAGFGADGLGMALAGPQLIEQAARIDPDAPPGVRRAMLMELVAHQLLSLGLQAGGELLGRARMARMHAGQAGPEAGLARANLALHEAFRRQLGDSPRVGGADVPIFQLETPGRVVELGYQIDGYGLVRDVHLRVGKDATEADLAPFASAVRACQRVEGVQGLIRRLIDRLNALLGGQRHIKVGSRAWEARLAIESLPRAMRSLHDRVRSRELDEAGVDRQLAQIRRDLARHEQALTEMEQGEGFVALREPEAQAALAAGYPTPPAGHFYVQEPDGSYQLERRVDDPAAAKRVGRGEGGKWEIVDAPPATDRGTRIPSRKQPSETAGQPGSKAHGQFGLDARARDRGEEALVAPQAFMNADYLLALYDGDVAALVQTLEGHYRGENPAVRSILERPSWPQVRQLLEGGGAVTRSEAADLRHLLALRNLDRIPAALRAAALAHSGVEVHNHYKGVLEADYYVKQLYGSDSDASYRQALDSIKKSYETSRDAPGTSPEVWALLQRGYDDETARSVYDQIMRASAAMPFDQTYDPRGMLIDQIKGQKGGARTLFRDTVRRLRADGITYAELQIKPDSLGITQEEFGRICLEEGVEVRILMHLVSERDLAGDRVLGEEDMLKMLKAGPNSPLGAEGALIPRDVLAGFDVAGPERAQFSEAGMKNVETAYRALARLAGEDGQARVLRPHVGEGYADGTEARGQGVERDGPEARIAQQNIQILLEQFQNMQRDGTYVKPSEGGKVLIRMGHVTHIAEGQARLMAELEIVAEVNIGSNVATGALPRQTTSVNRLAEHPLLMLLYHDVEVIQSTDAQGVMSTNLPKEYELAQQVIDEFKSDRRPLEIDGRILRWKRLGAQERADLDWRLNLDRIREAALRYQERAEAPQERTTL